MKQAVIDMGSNSIRLTLYKMEGGRFRILFREKIMAGLAAYVENGNLTEDGVESAVNALLSFREVVEALEIETVYVFATASLRNVKNTEVVRQEIEKQTGFSIEILSGEKEAHLGYLGAMQEVNLSSGVYADIGGASTEIVLFQDGKIEKASSFPVGSLSLYKRCVKKILPGSGSLRRIHDLLLIEMDERALFQMGNRKEIVCVGGTARAIRKLAGRCFHIPEEDCAVTAQQVEDLCTFLYRGDKQAADLILQTAPERIHTLVPGLAILRHIFMCFDAEKMIVSRYGVREGYICQKIKNEM